MDDRYYRFMVRFYFYMVMPLGMAIAFAALLLSHAEPNNQSAAPAASQAAESQQVEVKPQAATSKGPKVLFPPENECSTGRFN